MPDPALLVAGQGDVGAGRGLEAALDAGQGGGVLVEDAAEVAELGRVGPPLARRRDDGWARPAAGGPSPGTGSSNMTSMTAAVWSSPWGRNR